jgi:AhpD family alkylhydroperoxidase
MAQKNEIPTSIGKRETYKHKFSLLDMYSIFMNIPYAISIFIQNNKAHTLDLGFVERIMLAVTEVNGCAVCSYAHTQMALNQGMSNEEIFSMLSGDKKYIKPEESKAIFFAQHYAESGGLPEKQSFNAIELEYGKKKAAIILASIQLITAGNAYGIPQSAFKSRLKGRPYKDSSLIYEIGMQTIGILVFILAFIHGGVKKMVGVSHQKFS